MQIKRKKLIHGDILEIEMPNYGFIYAKYINVLSFFTESGYPDVLRVYNKCEEKPIDRLEILNRDLLFAPQPIAGIKGIIKRLDCKIIANESVNQDEEILPDVKRGHPPFINGYDESKYEKFMVLRNLGDVKDYYFSTSEKVKHLEWAGALNIEGLIFRIKIELLKIENKDIKKEEGIKDWLEQEIYDRTIRLPCYTKIEKKYRDKAMD